MWQTYPAFLKNNLKYCNQSDICACPCVRSELSNVGGQHWYAEENVSHQFVLISPTLEHVLLVFRQWFAR